MLCLEELPLSAHCLDTNTPLVVNEIQLGRPVAIQHDFLSLAGFSLQSASRMAGTPEYDIRRNFYNMGDYAHQFILNIVTVHFVSARLWMLGQVVIGLPQ